MIQITRNPRYSRNALHVHKHFMQLIILRKETEATACESNFMIPINFSTGILSRLLLILDASVSVELYFNAFLMQSRFLT